MNQSKISPKQSLRAPWRVDNALVDKGNAVWTTLKSGCLCPCQYCWQWPPAKKKKRLVEDLCWIVPHVPLMTKSEEGLNRPELSMTPSSNTTYLLRPLSWDCSSSVQFSPLIGRDWVVGAHEGPFSKDLLPVFSAGGHREQFHKWTPHPRPPLFQKSTSYFYVNGPLTIYYSTVHCPALLSM